MNSMGSSSQGGYRAAAVQTHPFSRRSGWWVGVLPGRRLRIRGGHPVGGRITLIVSHAFPVADSSQTSVSYGTTAVAENHVESPDEGNGQENERTHPTVGISAVVSLTDTVGRHHPQQATDRTAAPRPGTRPGSLARLSESVCDSSTACRRSDGGLLCLAEARLGL